jgi:peptide/nickel transport system permease protein
MLEASLSYLGIGVQPPTPSWGGMIQQGQYYYRSAPWLILFPGLAIMLTVLSFNLLGDGLRDALDPYQLH